MKKGKIAGLPRFREQGPLIDEGSDTHSVPEFESIDDLPDSPMLREYIESMKEKVNKSEKEIINSKPVRQYMKRLGVWKQVMEN